MEPLEAPTVVEDVFFRRIGLDVPLATLGCEKSWKEVPARGLAVSNTYGYTFFVHPDGFAAAKTAYLCQLAEELKEHVEADTSAKDKFVHSVDVRDVRSLVLSSDELLVAVISDLAVYLFDVPALVHKSDPNPFETISIGAEEGRVRDFSWSPSSAESYVLLATEGKLVAGAIGRSRNIIKEDVLAACWSPDGHHIAYATRDSQLSITTADLTQTFKFLLPKLSEPEDDDETTQVDTVQWVRPDSIMLGCVRTSSEEEEDDFQLLMIGCNEGDVAEEKATRIAVTFEPLFNSIESSVLPNNSGPYLLVEYLEPWHIAVVTSRRSVDDHIILVAWQSEGGYSPCSIEFGNDAWIPRIELPENQGDNIVIGMAIDRTTEQIKFPDPRDETGATLLPACPVLICLTLEGKLSLFSFARWGKPDAVSTCLDLPKSTRVGVDRNTTTEIAHHRAPVLDISHGITDEVRSDNESGSIKSDLEEGGDEDKVDTTVLYDGAGVSTAHARLESAGLGSLEELSDTLTEESEVSSLPMESVKKVSSSSWLSSSTEERVIIADIVGRSKSAGELAASQQTTSLYERFTMVAPRPDSVHSAEKISEAWGIGLMSSGHMSGERAAWGNIGTKGQQPAKEEKPMGSVASALEGMYRPFSGGSSSSQLAQQVQKPQSAVSIKEIPLSSRMPAVSFSQPAAPVAGITTFGPPASSQGKSVSSKLDQANQAIGTTTGSSVFPRASKEQQFGGQSKGVSNVEATFNLELEKVRKMAEHLDMQMSSFQAFIVKGNDNGGESLEELEEGISSLIETAKQCKKRVVEQQLAVEDLLDQGIRVDAWRMYAQSLAEQSGDVRYKDLWIHQKLHPELESRRKSVVEADQMIKQQIADLERHLNSLELNHRQQTKDGFRKKTSSSIHSQGQFQALQNLYNTVNTQRAVAEQLAHTVSLQMKALNISSTSRSSRTNALQPAAAGILRSLGLPVEEDKSSRSEGSFQSPVVKHRSNRSIFSPDSAEFVTPSWQHLRYEAESGPPDTTRRRRDSMDMAWVGAGAAKATIKRTARVKPVQSVSSSQHDAVKSQLRNFRKTTGRTTRETAQSSESLASPSYPQRKYVFTGSPEHPDEHQVAGVDWKLPSADTGNARPLFPALRAVRQSADIEQSRDSLFKWANTGSSSPSSGNAASFTVGASFGDVTIPQNGKPGQSTNRSMVTSNPGSSTTRPSGLSGEMSASRTALSGQPLGTGTIKAESKGTIPSYRPSLSRKLDLEAEAKSRYPTDVEPQFKSSEFDEEGRQESPRDSKMAKTRDSGMNGGFGSFRDRLMVSGLSNPGGQTSTFTMNSSLGSVFEPSLQSLASQPGPKPGPETSATQPPGTDTSIPVPVPVASSAPGKDAATTGGISFPGSQQPVISRAPETKLAVPSKLESLQPANFVADVSVSGKNAFSTMAQDSTGTSTSGAGQLSFPPTPQKPVEPVLPVETKAPPAFSITTTDSTKAAETPPQAFPSPPSSATGFGSPPASISRPQASPGFPISFPSFGASTSPSPPTSLFGQLPRTPNISSQHFGFPKPSSSASSVAFPAVPGENDEEVMEEEAPNATTSAFGSFGGFGGLGLGSSSTVTGGKANPFGVESVNLSPPPGFGTSSPGGQLFRPASFSLPAAQSSPPQSTGNTGNPFGSSLPMASGSAFGQGGLGGGSTGGGGFGAATTFGQAAKVGQGQHALGSALGAFGQTRQLGSGFGASGFSPPGSGGGFAGAASGGGFAGAATGGGFASAATGGGFASIASGGGFASLGQGGGFGNAAPGGGFAGASGGGAFGNVSSPGGFQSFSGNQGSTGFGGFGAPSGFGAGSQAPLFTQMRK